MPDVEITINNPGNPDSQYLKTSASGEIADALRTCIFRVAEQYADDPAVQRLSEAVYAAKDSR